MRRLADKLLICALVTVAIGSVVHPFGSVKQANRAILLDGMAVNPVAFGVIDRSCANCHSEQVKWPWYGYIAPASWLLENDVSRARSRLNLSRWAEYTSQEQETLLSAVGAAVRTGEMPPARYKLLHPEAELSSAERNLLYEWSRAGRRQLNKAQHLSQRVSEPAPGNRN